MNQLRALLQSLSTRQKISVAAAILLVGGGLYWFTNWNRERDFRPLYTGLSGEDAGVVVTKLKEMGVEYRVSDDGGVRVPSARVADVRLQLAAAGLPKTGRIGYELFDKTNFGVTDFAEQVNYHRALEGEIERSITSLTEVERARVHITFAKDSIFTEQQQPAKASVMLKLRTSRRLAPQNTLAIAHLVSSAVEGLAPESVSIVDMSGNLLTRARRNAPGETVEGDSAFEYRQRLEKDLIAKIGATVEPLVGPDRYRAGVSIDCDFSSGEQSEETFDPTKSVMVMSQKTEDVANGASSGGVPGTASNLPRGNGARTGGGYGVTRRTENVTFQSSRTVRKVRLPQGTIRRMSISLLIDHPVRWIGSGAKAKRVVEPPSPERLRSIRELVAAATGLQPDRGDQLILESLPFEGPAPEASDATPAAPGEGPSKWPQLPLPALAGVAAAAIAVAAALWSLMRRGRGNKKGKAEVRIETNAALPDKDTASESLQKQLEARLAEQSAERELQAQEVLNSLKLPPVKTKKTEVLTRQLAEETKKDPQAMAHVLRGWLAEKEH